MSDTEVPLATAPEKALDDLIRDYPDHWRQAIAKPSLGGWFVGRVMKAMHGNASPISVKNDVDRRLAAERILIDAARAEEEMEDRMAAAAIEKRPLWNAPQDEFYGSEG